MLVDLTDFNTRPYRIPDQTDHKDLVDFMEAKEEDILRSLFGTALYNQYVAGIAAGSPAQKWVDLRDGKVYTYGGVSFEYKGLVDLLVPCIFAYWVKETSDKYTSIGTVQNSSDSNTHVSPSRRITEAYGTFLDKVGDSCYYENTLYGFIEANLTDYSDWRTHNWPGSMNQFDL